MLKRGVNNKIFIFLGVAVLLAVVIGILLVIPSEPKSTSIYEQCKFACDTNQKASFCDVERKVNDDLKTTCKSLAEESQYSKYGVELCPAISCEPEATDQTCITGLGGVWETPVNGKCSQGGDKIRREVTSSDNPPVSGQICCR